MSTKAQIKASNKYNKENTKTYLLRLHKRNDADLIRYIDLLQDSHRSINAEIKDALRTKIMIKGIDI